ncbi:alpha/beta fold hydrolase [Murinocardiopsis flavida]|uniref:alpha/beta fold hydrolase n=1 Tax=Murinocardiopsis flavida TaxID=645275 RepID=UPI0011B27E41|nr:alpha/beta hydrolase [Murinocardiopsis flavida]
MPAPPRAADRVRTITTADGAALRVLVRGPDDAPLTVVLGHGWTLGSSTWERQTAALTDPARPGPAVRVVRWEQRGHCGSTLGTRPLGIDLLGDDLAAIIDTLAPTGRLVLGGHSMGAMTIMALAAERPDLVRDRVAGVALVATAAGRLDTSRPGFPLRARATGTAQRLIMGALARLPREADRLRSLAPPRLGAHRAAVRRLLFGRDADPLRVRECAELVHGCPAAVVAGYYGPLMRHDMTARLAALRDVDTVVLGGGADRLTPVRCARALGRALPGAEVRILPGLGHMLTVEAPDEVSGVLLRMCAA